MTHRSRKLAKGGVLASIILAELLASFALIQSSPLANEGDLQATGGIPPVLPCSITQPNCRDNAAGAALKSAEMGLRSPNERDEVGSGSILGEASPNDIWIPNPTIGGSPRPALRPGGPPVSEKPTGDTTPPSTPGNLKAATAGLYTLNISWDAATDPESGIQGYVYAIGTGKTEATEANLKWWQSVGNNTKVTANLVMTPGTPIYVSVKAVNGENLYSALMKIGPITPTHVPLGQASNVITYSLATVGQDETGNPTEGWSTTQRADLQRFLDRMFPVLYDLYGPPSVSYTVSVVRDQRQKASAIFYPSVDEMHLGDTLTYQLLTHELVHAWRNDRILSTDSLWQYHPKYSGFEEGFAQAVSYDAMTEFARRYPNFGLKQSLYQSSHEWDYDVLNIKELVTEDFWSDYGGTKLFWARYEMAAAAIAKIRAQYPTFYRDFNAEYYKRLNENPKLVISRDLIKAIVQTVAPIIEGKPADRWIDAQFIFNCEVVQGPKIFVYPEHYPFREFFIFNSIHFYNTFQSGSDWAYYDPATKTWGYHSLNDKRGKVTVRDPNGKVVAERPVIPNPSANPPIANQFGTAQLTLTTQFTRENWPLVDDSLMITNLITNGLYVINTEFYSGSITVTNVTTRLMGASFRNTSGVYGVIAGADGGKIGLQHRSYTGELTADLDGQFFHAKVPWASLVHTATNSVDTVPGVVDLRYTDKKGKVYTDTRVIGYGSMLGNQIFMLDIAKMNTNNGAPGVDSPITTPAPPTDTPTATPTPTPAVSQTPTPTVTASPTVNATTPRARRVYLSVLFDR